MTGRNGKQKFFIISIIIIVFTLFFYQTGFPIKNKLKDYNYNQTVNLFDDIPPPNPKDFINPNGYSYTIVTAASSNHWCELKKWIEQIKNLKYFLPEYINPRIIIYDLDLNKEHTIQLDALKSNGFFTEYRIFNFSKYPEFWDLRKNKTLKGEYGWKTGIIKEISDEFPGIIIWSDAGTLIGQKILENLPVILELHEGFISPLSRNSLTNWTHPGVFKYFNDTANKYSNVSNCNAAIIFFDTRKTQHLINKLYECALEKECIAPPGSNRTNHRQDQAILTYLITKDNRKCEILELNLGVKSHGLDKDCRNDKKIQKYLEQLLKYKI